MKRKAGPSVWSQWFGWVAEDAKRSTSPLGAAEPPTPRQWFEVGQVVRARRIRRKDKDRVMAVVAEVRRATAQKQE